jgi:hypothetical protein
MCTFMGMHAGRDMHIDVGLAIISGSKIMDMLSNH